MSDKPKREHNRQTAFLIVQLVNNKLIACELEEYFPPRKLGFHTYQQEIATNSDDTHEELLQRIDRHAKRFLLESGFESVVVHRLNRTVLSSTTVSL